jgi:hypothetical protein
LLASAYALLTPRRSTACGHLAAIGISLLGHRAWTCRARPIPVAGSRHLNVGEEQANVDAGFQQFERSVGILGFNHGKASFLKRVGSDHAQKRIVFDCEVAG